MSRTYWLWSGTHLIHKISANYANERALRPILLFNDECGVCRSIADWVKNQAQANSVIASIIVRPIGQDPEKLRSLNPDLDIWGAYETIHLLMPDGSMKLGGEAVAEVLRSLPGTRWFAWTFAISVFGVRPFQAMLNLAYTILAEMRPVLGCESCGTPSLWLRPFRWLVRLIAPPSSKNHNPSRHFTSLPARVRVQPAKQI